MILGDLGAEVIKIEEPSKGDDTRSWGPPFAPLQNSTNSVSSGGQRGESAYFLAVNRNKKSVTLNLKSAQGREILRRLARECDVVVENYLPGKLHQLGCGYEQLSKVNDRLVWASITGYGPTGPYAHRPGYDVIIEAEGGLMHITGEPDGEPVKVGVAIIDLVTGLYAHGAIMAALLARQKSGKGQKIDLSLLESQLAVLVNIGSNYLIGEQEAKRWGTRHASIVPYQAFKTMDSRIVVGAGNDRQFKSLCTAMDRVELINDTRFIDNASRVKHRKELVELLETQFQTQSTSYWLKKLDGSGMPFGPVNTIGQALQHPQALHRDMVVEMDHPSVGKFKMVGIPVKYSETHPGIRLPPPTLGQHTNEVLKEIIGLSDEQIDTYRSEGAL